MFTQAARTPTLNSLFLMALAPSAAVASGGTVTVEYYVATAGAGLTYGRIGIYSYAGGTATLIGSADVSTAVTTTGSKTVGVAVSPGFAQGDLLYAGCLFVGTTAPALTGGVISYVVGRGAPYRQGALASQASLPSTVTMSATTTATSLFFFALL